MNNNLTLLIKRLHNSFLPLMFLFVFIFISKKQSPSILVISFLIAFVKNYIESLPFHIFNF
jgi:hypothetical protein